MLERLRPAFRATLRRLRVEESEGEDLIQLLALVYLLKAPGIRNQQAWLRGTLGKLCLLHHRRRARQERAFRLVAAGSRATTDPAWRELELGTCLGRLPLRSRRALELHYLEGFTLEETADLLGYRLSSMKRTLNRALRQASR